MPHSDECAKVCKNCCDLVKASPTTIYFSDVTPQKQIIVVNTISASTAPFAQHVCMHTSTTLNIVGFDHKSDCILGFTLDMATHS